MSPTKNKRALVAAVIVVAGPGFFGCKDHQQATPAPGTARVDDAGLIEHRTASDIDSIPQITPDWTRAVDRVSESLFLERVHGPVVAGKSVLVSSSAIGVAAVDAASGAVRWQRGRHAPVRAVRGPGPDAGTDQVWLPGPCEGARPGTVAATQLGCVEILDSNGMAFEARMALPAPPGGVDGGLPSQSGVLGAWARELLWAQARDVLAIEPRPGATWTRYRLPGALQRRICGWHAEADILLVATCDGLASFARASGPESKAAWHVVVPRTTDVAGPIRGGERVIWVHDQVLEAVQDNGQPGWRASGRYAQAPGSLWATNQERFMAVRLEDGIQPAVLDSIGGQVVSTGEVAPGIQVLAAAFTHRATILVVRLDSSLMRDAVIAYDREQRIAWAWPVPAPQAPRIVPIGLAASQQAVFVFHDGRYLTRLPLP